MFLSRPLPCPECGASVARDATAPHSCDPQRRMDYRLDGMRDEIASFEMSFRNHLNRPLGRLEAWVAAQAVRRAP